MDDNVLKRYTTKATRASEYVQYDQGKSLPELRIPLNILSQYLLTPVVFSNEECPKCPMGENVSSFETDLDPFGGDGMGWGWLDEKPKNSIISTTTTTTTNSGMYFQHRS